MASRRPEKPSFRAQWAEWSDPIRAAWIALVVAFIPVVVLLSGLSWRGLLISTWFLAAAHLRRIIERDYPHHRT